MTGRITVIGYDGAALSAAARTALGDATLVAGGRRHLDAVGVPPGVPVVEIGAIDLALRDIAAHDGDVVVLASGDPGLFGILRRLRGLGRECVVLPAVSSVAHAFARLGLPWDDAVVVSAHGRPLAPVVAVCRAYPKVGVLTAPGAGPAEIGAALCGTGRTLVVATALGSPDEDVVELAPEDAAGKQWREPNVVVVLDPSRPDAGRGWIAGGERVPDGWALPEPAFEHRDRMITKSEVRAVVLARLAPRPGTVVWDIGSGSGSVAVECARFGADVVAIERDSEQCERIAANAAAHAVDVQVVRGSAPDVLPGLRNADAVFLGGGGPGALASALDLTRPRRAVAALTALDRVAPVLAVLSDRGYAVEGVQLQANRLTVLPDGGHRLAAGNPVFVVWGVTQ